MISSTPDNEQKKLSGRHQNALLSELKYLRMRKTHIVVEESIRALLEGFKETHDPKLEARNIKIELMCESYDTLFNVGDFFPKAYEIKSVLEKRGFKRAFFYVNGRKSKTPALNFTVSYWDVDPRDPFTGTPYFELLRTEG